MKVLQDMEGQGMIDEDGYTDVQGFSWNGQAYLAADNLGNNHEALFVLMHELAHGGLGNLLNRDTPNVKRCSILLQVASVQPASLSVIAAYHENILTFPREHCSGCLARH